MSDIIKEINWNIEYAVTRDMLFELLQDAYDDVGVYGFFTINTIDGEAVTFETAVAE